MSTKPPVPDGCDLPRAATALRESLDAIGFHGDPEMDTTPERVSQFLSEFRPGPPPPVTPLTTLSSNPIVIRSIPYYSLCAHHLLPFFGHCTIVYLPNGAIAGLGWFPRLLEALARRPQLQERLAENLVQEVYQALNPTGVAVSITARQMCVEMRGARSPGTYEVTASAGDAAPDLLAMLTRRG